MCPIIEICAPVAFWAFGEVAEVLIKVRISPVSHACRVDEADRMRKKAKYCSVHSSVQARSQRYRDSIKQRVTPAELKERRRRYYRNRKAKLRLANLRGSNAHGK